MTEQAHGGVYVDVIFPAHRRVIMAQGVRRDDGFVQAAEVARIAVVFIGVNVWLLIGDFLGHVASDHQADPHALRSGLGQRSAAYRGGQNKSGRKPALRPQDRGQLLRKRQQAVGRLGFQLARSSAGLIVDIALDVDDTFFPVDIAPLQAARLARAHAEVVEEGEI